MAKFMIRRLLLMLLTMFLVSVAVFLITEAAPGNVARNVLGIQITPAQEASFLNQIGLDEPMYERYLNWLFGTDWRAERHVDMPVKRVTTEDGFKEWWAVEEDGSLVRWQLEGGDLIARQRQPDGSVEQYVDNERWNVQDPQKEIDRLEAYRATVQENPQLTEEAQQSIVQQIDGILGILRSADQAGDTLKSRLAEPESALDDLIDPQAAEKKNALSNVAETLSKNRLIQALGVHQDLADATSGDFEQSNLQAMARRLTPAAAAIEDGHPEAAEQLRQAADSLNAGEIAAARDALSKAAPTLHELTGSLSTFARALEEANYQQAAGVLEDLSDPAELSLEGAQREFVVAELEKAAESLSDGMPALSEALLQATEALSNEAGADVAAARDAFREAAGILRVAGYTVARSDAAQQAKVGRQFWGIDTENHAVRWEKGAGEAVWVFIVGTGWKAFSGGPTEYIPLQKGLLRGDPGMSLRTGRPVADSIFTRLRNSLVLAGIAFALVMPLALALGLIAGLNEGKFLDRFLSIGGMMFSVTPEFATGIFLILIFATWLDLVPGATVFGEDAPWSRLDMLVLPVLTLTLIELGYVLRITRASMVDVMKAPYIRTAFLKGLPYWRVVSRHAIRNALMAPITVIMLHVNWLLGGIVVVEVIFGYPGLGSYLLESALFKDFNAIEAGSMILVTVAVGTQLIADIAYTFLNPRIRYG